MVGWFQRNDKANLEWLSGISNPPAYRKDLKIFYHSSTVQAENFIRIFLICYGTPDFTTFRFSLLLFSPLIFENRAVDFGGNEYSG